MTTTTDYNSHNNLKFEYDLTLIKTYLTMLNSEIVDKEFLESISPEFTSWLVSYFKGNTKVPVNKIPFFHNSLYKGYSGNFKDVYDNISMKDLAELPQLKFLTKKDIYRIPLINSDDLRTLIKSKEQNLSYVGLMVYPLDLPDYDSIEELKQEVQKRFFDLVLNKAESVNDITTYNCNLDLHEYKKSYVSRLKKCPKDVHYYGYVNSNSQPVILSYISKKEFKNKRISVAKNRVQSKANGKFLERVLVQDNMLRRLKIKNPLKGYLIKSYKDLYLLKTPLGYKTKVYLIVGSGSLDDTFFEAKLLIKD